MSSLDVSATGMHVSQVMIDVYSNNVVNSNTTGFKKSLAQIQDLPYIDKNRIGFSLGTGEDGNSVPVGFQIGLGAEVVGVRTVFTQGTVMQTDKELDLAIQGKGFFIFVDDNGDNFYSRDGAFSLNSEGQIVNSHGYLLSPEITVPEDAVKVLINRNGVVEASVVGEIDPVVLGQIELASFINEDGLYKVGGNLFAESNISGEPIILNFSDGNGVVLQGYLEASNADPISSITGLLQAQRGYEMCSKAFQVSVDVYKQINNIQT